MPIAAKQQIFTTDDKLTNVLRIISTLRSPADQNFIKDFVLELCTRYINKDKELSAYVRPSMEDMNRFEREYLERIIKEFTT